MKTFLKFLMVVFLFSTLQLFSQKTPLDLKQNEIPKSIYSSTLISQDLNSALNINSRLKLSSYKFLFIDENKIEEGYFSIPFYNLKQSPTKYIYDSYNKVYNNLSITQGHFKVSDLYKTRPINPF